jgi:hypothetical protein
MEKDFSHLLHVVLHGVGETNLYTWASLCLVWGFKLLLPNLIDIISAVKQNLFKREVKSSVLISTDLFIVTSLEQEVIFTAVEQISYFSPLHLPHIRVSVMTLYQFLYI